MNNSCFGGVGNEITFENQVLLEAPGRVISIPPNQWVRTNAKAMFLECLTVIALLQQLALTAVDPHCPSGDGGILAYSSRSATTGSTRIARRAGTHDAASATLTSRIAHPANVIGSCALTP